ncbi:MAG: hypothetical protein KC912_07145 [Proteobacteria bacterium]|nr:hypothetical protein [Pseudomonadota bacterium]
MREVGRIAPAALLTRGPTLWSPVTRARVMGAAPSLPAEEELLAVVEPPFEIAGPLELDEAPDVDEVEGAGEERPSGDVSSSRIAWTSWGTNAWTSGTEPRTSSASPTDVGVGSAIEMLISATAAGMRLLQDMLSSMPQPVATVLMLQRTDAAIRRLVTPLTARDGW